MFGFNELIMPEEGRCFFCGEKDDLEGYLCPDCREKIIPLNKDFNGKLENVEKVVFSVDYNIFTKDAIYAFKYGGKSYYYKALGAYMVDTFRERFSEDDIDIITYVPLHRRKKAKRGFNQSQLLAEYIAHECNIPISKGNLVRTRETYVQNRLDRVEREKNLAGVFKVKNPIKFYDKKIILIDDIITTGVTLNQCGKVLREAGAKNVYGLALFSGKKR